MTIDEYIIEQIRKYLTENGYLEGEEEDYYFSDASVNEHPMLLCKDSLIYSKICQLTRHVFAEYNRSCGGLYLDPNKIDMAAFNIHFVIYTREISEGNECGINISVKDEFYDSLKNDSKRWEAYLKLHNKSSLKELFADKIK